MRRARGRLPCHRSGDSSIFFIVFVGTDFLCGKAYGTKRLVHGATYSVHTNTSNLHSAYIHMCTLIETSLVYVSRAAPQGHAHLTSAPHLLRSLLQLPSQQRPRALPRASPRRPRTTPTATGLARYPSPPLEHKAPLALWPARAAWSLFARKLVVLRQRCDASAWEVHGR